MKRTLSLLLLLFHGFAQSAPDVLVVSADFPNSGTGFPNKNISVPYTVKVTNSSGSSAIYRLHVSPPPGFVSGDNAIQINTFSTQSGTINVGTTWTTSGSFQINSLSANVGGGVPEGPFDTFFPLIFTVSRVYGSSQFARRTLVSEAGGGVRCTGTRISSASTSPAASYSGSWNWEIVDSGVYSNFVPVRVRGNSGSATGHSVASSANDSQGILRVFSGSERWGVFPFVIGEVYSMNGTVTSGGSYTGLLDGNYLWDVEGADFGSAAEGGEELDWSVLSVQIEFLAYSVFGSAAAAAVVLAFKNLTPA